MSDHWRDTYDAWKLATPPEYDEEQRRERDVADPAFNKAMQIEILALAGRWEVALKKIIDWRGYSVKHQEYDEPPDDPIVEAYERGANDMLETLQAIAAASFRDPEEVS